MTLKIISFLTFFVICLSPVVYSEETKSEEAKPPDNETGKKVDELKSQVDELKKKIDEIYEKNKKLEYITEYFQVNFGAVTLNPYAIRKDANDKFMLEQSGSRDTHFFMEVLLKKREAWLGDMKCQGEGKLGFDGDLRIGFTDVSKDPSGAVVSGAGDAYMEGSISLAKFIDKNPSLYSINVELFGGLVTDKGAQSIHYYSGIGPVIVMGVPYSDNRKIEALAGAYIGATQMPDMVNSETREVKQRNQLPQFKDVPVSIWRGDVHLPIGEKGFLIVAGRFFYITPDSTTGSGSISPWTVSLGYTIPVEEILKSVANIIHQ